ncbi:MAG: hypothetical protein ACM3XZ_02555 [Betaproteobacteria bacterium]
MTEGATFSLRQWWARLRQAGKNGWLLLLGLLGVVLLAMGSLSPGSTDAPVTRFGEAGTKHPTSPHAGEDSPAAAASEADQYAVELEQALAETLSQVAGAGDVSVRIFLASGPRYEYARKTSADTRTTQESDPGGSSRVISEQHEEGEVTVRRGGAGGEDVPVVVVTHLPAVQGVLVVASGATDPMVRAELSRAVQTALNLPPHRVRVLAKEGE